MQADYEHPEDSLLWLPPLGHWPSRYHMHHSAKHFFQVKLMNNTALASLFAILIIILAKRCISGIGIPLGHESSSFFTSRQ
jgi:hypothetical protein